MPLYNTATTATALNVSPKWLDNLLSHNDLTGVQSESQGVSRRLPLSTVVTVALTKQLIDGLGLSAGTAVRLAEELTRNSDGNGDREVALSPHLRLGVELGSLRSSIVDQLSHAVETAPSPRRGRPPKR